MTQEFTHRFTEVHEPGGTLYPANRAAGIYNTTWLDMANHQRMVFLVAVGVIAAGGTVDFDVQEDIAGDGVALGPIAGKSITELTQGGGDGDELIAVEVRSEELTPGYRYVRGVLTVGINTAYACVIPLRGCSNFLPVPATGWTEIVD